MSGPSPIYRQMAKWFMKRFLPWFIKNVWPLVKDDVERIVKKVFAQMRELVDELIDGRKVRQEDVARKKAEEAEQQASQAHTSAELEKYRAVAEAWREAAEMFREENEILKSKLDRAISESESQLKVELDGVDIGSMIEERNDGKLLVRGTDDALSLPAPDDDTEWAVPLTSRTPMA